MRRQLSLDFLRILSMLGIIGLHVVNQGGVTSKLVLGTNTELSISLFRAIIYTSVNLFAMISGYCYADKTRVNNKRIVELWVVCLLYSFIISLLTFIKTPELFQSRSCTL